MLDNAAYGQVVRAFKGAARATTEQLAHAAGTSPDTVKKVLAGQPVRDRERVGIAAAELADLPVEFLELGLTTGPLDPALATLLDEPVRVVLSKALAAVLDEPMRVVLARALGPG